MRIAVIYDSLTGNTELLAKEIQKEIAAEDLVYFGRVQENIEADLYIVGSWIDKGSCSEKIGKFLRQLNNKQIAFFSITPNLLGKGEVFAVVVANGTE